jgi:hypothetical protein
LVNSISKQNFGYIPIKKLEGKAPESVIFLPCVEMYKHKAPQQDDFTAEQIDYHARLAIGSALSKMLFEYPIDGFVPTVYSRKMLNQSISLCIYFAIYDIIKKMEPRL